MEINWLLLDSTHVSAKLADFPEFSLNEEYRLSLTISFNDAPFGRNRVRKMGRLTDEIR